MSYEGRHSLPSHFLILHPEDYSSNGVWRPHLHQPWHSLPHGRADFWGINGSSSLQAGYWKSPLSLLLKADETSKGHISGTCPIRDIQTLLWIWIHSVLRSLPVWAESVANITFPQKAITGMGLPESLTEELSKSSSPRATIKLDKMVQNNYFWNLDFDQRQTKKQKTKTTDKHLFPPQNSWISVRMGRVYVFCLRLLSALAPISEAQVVLPQQGRPWAPLPERLSQYGDWWMKLG